MTEETPTLKPLSKKHQKVQDEYLLCFKQWVAYKAAFPNVTDESARSLSSKLFADVNFKAHLDKRITESQMGVEEALSLQANIARGDITDLLTPLGHVDVGHIRDSGMGRLVKKIKQRTITKIGKGEKDDDTEIHETEIELYPADVAQERILKMHGKFKDRIDLSNEDGSLQAVPVEEIARRVSVLVEIAKTRKKNAGK